jgi:anti-sigma regulatory factor (Ser/Thr protein kinase)
MLNATSRDRIAEQFRDAADAVRVLAIQEDEETADLTTGIPVRVTRGKRTLMLTSGAPVPVLPPQYQGTDMIGEWPLRDFIELGALPGAVPCARLHARQLLWEWGLTGLSESVELLVSELVTNAVQESRSMERITPVRLWLLADKTRVMILVWDASPRGPVRMNISDEAQSGRGLLLVEGISDKWDWYIPPATGGKVVWALVARS